MPRLRSPVSFHAIARAMRPPSSGKAGIRLKTKSPALTSASQPSTASAGARVVAQDQGVAEVVAAADQHAAPRRPATTISSVTAGPAALTRNSSPGDSLSRLSLAMPPKNHRSMPGDLDAVAPRDPRVAELVQRERQEEQGHGGDGHDVAGRLAVLVVVGGREPDDEDQGDDEPARARADADPEDPCELDRPCSHSHTWWQASSSSRADAPTHGLCVFPSPRRMPRLGNVRLSVKLGLCFGAILALTAAIIAVEPASTSQALESAHERVTPAWCRASWPPSTPTPRSPTLHFAQTPMVLANGAPARRRGGRPQRSSSSAVGRPARPTADDSARAWPRSTPPSSGSRTSDAKLYAAVKRGDRVGATELVSSYVDEAADGVTERHRAPTSTQRQPRARGGRRALRQRRGRRHAH